MIIRGEMNIDEIISLVPSAEGILAQYSLSCASCSASGFETLKDGVLGHGYDQETLDSLLRDLNNLLTDYDKNVKRIGMYITDNALEKLNFFAEEMKKKEYGLKIQRTKNKELDSYTYSMDFQKKPGAKDYTIPYNKEWKIFVSEKDMDNLKGLLIDFVESALGTGFKLINPQDKN